jgi:hypothetical protein
MLQIKTALDYHIDPRAADFSMPVRTVRPPVYLKVQTDMSARN